LAPATEERLAVSPRGRARVTHRRSGLSQISTSPLRTLAMPVDGTYSNGRRLDAADNAVDSMRFRAGTVLYAQQSASQFGMEQFKRVPRLLVELRRELWWT